MDQQDKNRDETERKETAGPQEQPRWSKAECKRFYDSATWAQKRDAILKRDHYECAECRRRIEQAKADGRQLTARERRIHRADCVHHIKHLEDHPELALDDDNLEAVCNQCHNHLHGRYLPHPFRPAKNILNSERW